MSENRYPCEKTGLLTLDLTLYRYLLRDIPKVLLVYWQQQRAQFAWISMSMKVTSIPAIVSPIAFTYIYI